MASTLSEWFSRPRPHRRIVLLTDGYTSPFLAKTAINLLRYRTSDIAALIDRSAAGKTAGEVLGVGGEVPVIADLGDCRDADAVYVGIAPPGGKLPREWRGTIMAALSRGLDVVSGLHEFLHDDAQYVEAAGRSGSSLVDVRRNRFKETATGQPFREGCIRIHAVGNDCSIGKMVAMMELARALAAQGEDAKFLATGQTGIMISGEGIPIDCIVSDFVNGAAEMLVAENQQHEFLLVEGQGSISHPAFSAVTLGLLHGSAPQGLVYCYEAGRKQVKGLDNVDIPPMRQQLQACEVMANLRHPCRTIAVVINTRTLNDQQAKDEINWAEQEFGLPACDVYRTGTDKLVTAALRLRKELSPS
jgi:uncharacterized NAD-dependent epimerase/dehydratase family protein